MKAYYVENSSSELKYEEKMKMMESVTPRYTLEYLKSFIGAEWKRGVGERTVWHDVFLHKWRLRIQLDEENYWYLSVFIHDDGSFDKYSLDEEAASDSHYEFVNEEGVRRRLFQPGDERLLFDTVLIRYVKENSGNALLKMIRPSVTKEFHYYDD